MITSGRTEILLSDGSLQKAAILSQRKDLKAFAYVDGEFVVTQLTVNPVSSCKLHRLRTVSGRVLEIADSGSVLSTGEEWLPLSEVAHTTPGKNPGNFQNIMELGNLPIDGPDSQDGYWIDTVSKSLWINQKSEEFPAYLARLKATELHRLLVPHLFNTNAPKVLSFNNLLSRNRFLHVLTRLGIHGDGNIDSAQGKTTCYVATRTQATYTPLVEGTIREYHDIVRVPGFEITTSHGNILEKNLICLAR